MAETSSATRWSRGNAPKRCSPTRPPSRSNITSLSGSWFCAVDIGVGGSIGFVTAYAAAFPEAEILITGVEDPGTRAHGTNESLDLAVFERACLAEALLLRNLAGG